MNDDSIRFAIAVGWLIDRLAKAEGAPLVRVASELLIYMERIEADLRTWKGQND